MTHDQYVATVSRLEEIAAADPASYRLRVGALAVLGYAYVVGVLLVLAVALALIVWGLLEAHGAILLAKLALPILALIGGLGRALWVRVTPPAGRELRLGDAPVLFAEIDAVRRAAGAPAPHHVIVTDELNASVYQVPRLGIFGWHRNYLSLGLPLLAALTPDQFRAVVAHEFGHLSGAHARFGNWIYRVRGTWAQIEQTIQQRRSRLGGLLVNNFVEWYEPYFRAYSFVLARRHEVDADQTSAEIAGGDVVVQALTAIELRSRYRNQIVWPRITARIIDEPTPPRAAFARYVEEIPAEMPLSDATNWLVAALRVESGVDDPHPSLADRLQALGALPPDDAALGRMAERLAKPIDPAVTAAAHYLGALAPRLANELDERWCDAVAAKWKDRHRHLVRARDGLRELLARGESAPLTPDEQFRVADWTEDVHGVDAAVPLVTALVQRCPTHASGLFMLGRILLAANDEAGIAYLERAVEIDPGAVGAASALIASHLQQVGRGREAVAHRTRAEESFAEDSGAAAERRSIAPHDTLTGAALDDMARARLREELAAHPLVARAWLARKVTQFAPERPYFVLGVVRADSWWRYESEGSCQRLARTLADDLTLPARTLVVVLDYKRSWLRRALQKVANAEVYRRGR